MIVFAEVFEAEGGIVLCTIRVKGRTVGLVRFKADTRQLPFDPRRCCIYLSHDTLLQGAA